jgi:hypothetical protein
MALPKLDVPIYELELPSTEETISYRPFLVKEEKILLMAMEGEDQKEITKAIKQIINNCIVSEPALKVDKLPLFDIEFILLNLRSRSMGDMIKTSYSRRGCEDPDCKPIEFEIDIGTISVHKDPEHTNKIELTDSIGIIMKYPDVNLMAGMGNISEIKTDDAFDMIVKCIDKIYDEDEVSNQKDYTPKELKAWIESLTQEQFAKIEKFFNTVPKMYKDVKFNCKKCGYKEDIRIEGLASFFG